MATAVKSVEMCSFVIWVEPSTLNKQKLFFSNLLLFYEVTFGS